MAQRAGPTPDFPNRVCVARLAPSDRRVSVAGATLAAPFRRVNRIVIIGDTGCRMKGRYTQHCNDPGGWPFARVAALAAARRPDLVIHVGDYYYREAPCRVGVAGCAGSPWGDRWATWKAELFDPAAPLLAAAPWVFARGNHEDCGRGAAGWFRQLDAARAAKTCPAESDSFIVDLAGIRLLVVDSADTEDVLAPADEVAAFTRRLALASAPSRPRDPGAPLWIVTHRPVWFATRFADLVGDGLVNATERKAVRGADLSAADMIVSGHVHNFTTLSFRSIRPAQLVAGTGGDELDNDDAPPATAGTAWVDGLPADVFTMGGWGYFILDRRGAEWVGEFHDLTDRARAVCRLKGRDLICGKPPG
jgi:hypothetical protein